MNPHEEIQQRWPTHRKNVEEAHQLIDQRKALEAGRHNYPDHQGGVQRSLYAIDARLNQLRNQDHHTLARLKELILNLPEGEPGESLEKARLMADYVTLLEGPPFPEMPEGFDLWQH